MKDPIGPQPKIKSDEYHQSSQKLIDGGGAKKDYDGISYGRSTRAADSPSTEDKWQGKVKGRTKHTFGVGD